MVRKRYSNTDPAATVKTWKEIRQWQQERKGKVKDLSFRIGQSEHKQQELLWNNRSETTITWIGHATFLMQMAGLTIVTDRCGLTGWVSSAGWRHQGLRSKRYRR